MDQKTAIVTGGLGGIGIEIGRSLLNHKVNNLCILDIAEDSTAATKLAAEFPNRIVFFQQCDVSDRDALDKAFSTIREKHGSIDIVVNNAGVFYDSNLEKTLSINTAGVIKSSLSALHYMSISNGGRGGVILNMASVCGLGPTYFSPIYTASKYAVVGFTRSMAHKFYENRDGVKFMLICPGITTTPLFDTVFERVLFTELKEGLVDCLATKTYQTPDVIGKTVLQALETDRNGSVWLCEGGVIKEIELSEPTTELSAKEGVLSPSKDFEAN